MAHHGMASKFYPHAAGGRQRSELFAGPCPSKNKRHDLIMPPAPVFAAGDRATDNGTCTLMMSSRLWGLP
eukprot:jgi/Mesen1/6534/ME000333S05838